jgi:hypothetical protein
MNYVKLPVLIFLPLLFSLCTACNQNASSLKSDLKLTEKCFLAIYEQDTAHLNLIFTGAKVQGELQINYADGKNYNGFLKGLTKGDTLLLDYDFKINGINQWYRNPLALLKRSSLLILGDGKVDVRWGTGVFDKIIPINYENAKFVFKEMACVVYK